MLSSAWFTDFNATVIVTMDEHSGDKTGGGGVIPEVVISSNAKGQGNVAVKGNHYGTLRSIEEAYGLSLLGAAANASNGDLTSLFGSSVTPPTPTPSPSRPRLARLAIAAASPTPSPTPSPSPTPTLRPCSVRVTSRLPCRRGQQGRDGDHLGGDVLAVESHRGSQRADRSSSAGQNRTFLVQHARINIFQITAAHVTVEDMDLDTATYNPGVPPIVGNPSPGVLFSDASYTSVIDVTAEAGTGYGMRIAGPSSCSSDVNTGAVVSGVTMTTTGTGGFSSIDVDCQQSAALTNLLVHGGSVTPYQDANLTLNGLVYIRGPYAETCEPAWEVTGPTVSILISNVITAAGYGREIASPSGVVVTNEALAPGDTCS